MPTGNAALNILTKPSRSRSLSHIHLTSKATASLIARLHLVEECLRQDRPGVAVEILQEAKAHYSSSSSLLIKILLSDLYELFVKRPREKLVLMRSVSALKAKLIERLHDEGSYHQYRSRHLH